MTLFAELPETWTPVLPADHLGRDPVKLTLAGEPIVLFRGAEGPAALLDRCPHRGVSLSLGKVVDGCLQCPFHGWRFQADGACAHVPFNPDVDRRRLSATALPVQELAGLIWVYTGTEAQGEPIVGEALLRPGVGRSFQMVDWECHWTRAMENMLDTPHLPFVHSGTIGAGIRKAMRPDSRLDQVITDTPTGFDIRFNLEGEGPGQLSWQRPNGMVLHILDQPGRLMRLHVFCVPMEENRTRLIVAAALDFGVFTSLAVLAGRMNNRVILEDKAVVESSSPIRVPPATEEVSVPTDKPTLRFRTWYFRTWRARAAQPGLDSVDSAAATASAS